VNSFQEEMQMDGRVRTIVITGMSGAGKTVAMQSLEDIGYFCVDNLPPLLIPKFVEIVEQSSGTLDKVALACDLRGGQMFQSLLDTLAALRLHPHLDLTLVFLDASDAALVRRYKESRRRHPFAPSSRLLEGITAERTALARVRAKSDLVFDTSDWKPIRLKQELKTRFTEQKAHLPVHIVSFGFKYGVPIDADMILDVRFLPNPHYIDELRPYTGEDGPVYDYVMQWPATKEFLSKTEELLDFLIPEYRKEGKSHFVIGIGCTGGKHRSVAIARHVYDHLSQSAEVQITHRDSGREA
jgi:RNase adapter protein RapZ